MFDRCNRKTFCIVLLTICLVFSSIDPVFAVPEGTDGSEVTISENESVSDGSMSENDTEYIDAEETTDIISEEAAGDTSDHETGYIPVPMDVPATYYPEGTEEPAGSLESVYIPDINSEITDVKDQGTEGICWAYSAAAVLEQSAIKTGLRNILIDYNEDQLEDAFTEIHRDDPLGLTSGDRVRKNRGGNNNLFTTWLLASQAAPVLQGVSKTAGYSDREVSLIEARIIPTNEIDVIKQAIKDYGAVTIGIDATNYMGPNKLLYGYRNNDHYGENHGITLVGWDDTIPKEEFADKNDDYNSTEYYHNCPRNGGFYFKNSWGSSIVGKGFQYISYADAAFNGTSQYAIAYKVGPADAFNTVYEYDGSYGKRAEYVTRAANIYTASANDQTNGSEIINRVGFGTYDPGEYKVCVYENLRHEEMTEAVTGQWFMNNENLVAEKTITVPNTGFYTADFDNPPTIEEGAEFAVVLEKTDKSGFSVFTDESYDNQDWISFYADTSNEKTFVQDNYGYKSTASFTPRLKAFTKNISNVPPVETDLSTGSVTLRKTSFTFTGSQIKPVVSVKDRNGTIIPMTGNYSVSYGENINKGTGTVVVSALNGGLCTGSKTLSFSIEPADLSDTISYYYSHGWNEFAIERVPYPLMPFYTKEMVSKFSKLSYNGIELVPGKDYYVSDPDTVIDSETETHIDLIGIGNYKGSRYGVAKRNDQKIDISTNYRNTLPDGFEARWSTIQKDEGKQVPYTGELPVITDLKLTHTTRGDLVPGIDYTITNNNTTAKNAGERFTVTASGIGFFSGTKNFTITINNANGNLADALISGITDKTYTGSAITQDGITVTLNGQTLKKGTDYTLEYSNNVLPGSSASVRIKGRGKYQGEITKTFTINKATPVLSDLSATDIFLGQDLSCSIVSGTAKNGSVPVPGSYSFKDSLSTCPPVGTSQYDVIFTPDNLTVYEKVNGKVNLTVIDYEGALTIPYIPEITYRPNLSLSDVIIENPAENEPGSWQWKNPDTQLSVPGNAYPAIFTPDNESHEKAEFNISVRVNKAVSVISAEDQKTLDSMTLPKGQNLSAISSKLPYGFRWDDGEDVTTIYDTVGELIYALVIYNADSQNYYDKIGEAKITVVDTATHPKIVSVKVINGIALLDGKQVTSATPGTKLDLIATVPEGMLFKTWKVTHAKLEADTEQTQLTVGDDNVTAEAVLEEDPDYDEEEPPEKEPYDGKIKSFTIKNVETNKKVKSLKLAKGEAVFLFGDVVMSRGEAPDVHFRSGNSKVIRVNDGGKVTGFGSGTADVIAYCGDKTAKCTVTVTEEIEDISLKSQKDTMIVGEKMVIRPEIYPLTSAADRTVNWSVDNKKLASVAGGSEGCVLTAKKSGSVTVTAKIKTTDPHGQKKTLTKTCTVRIEEVKTEPVSSADKSYKLSFKKKKVKIDGIGNTNAVIAVLSNPSKADSVSIDWVSSNEDVIKILQAEPSATASGKKAYAVATVSGCGTGWAYITAKVRDNESGLVNVNRCKVTVNAPVKNIEIYGDSLNLYDGGVIELRRGQKDRLYVDVFPYSPTNINKISWSAKGGVTVKNGVIYASKITSASSSVTVKCGNIKRTVKIIITK
ncbi:MAG: Ig-like domain-containing protein [Lachnospiraceae bacterium]|nr:Ig-like domain-containing protein [Lachnospiraceae bacterium]